MTNDLLAELPGIDGVATTEEEKLALVRMWLAQWANPSRGHLVPVHDRRSGGGQKGGVKPHAGKLPGNRALARHSRRKKEVQGDLAADASNQILRANWPKEVSPARWQRRA